VIQFFSNFAIRNSLFSDVDQSNCVIDERRNILSFNIGFDLLSNLDGLLDVLEAWCNVSNFVNLGQSFTGSAFWESLLDIINGNSQILEDWSDVLLGIYVINEGGHIFNDLDGILDAFNWVESFNGSKDIVSH